MISEQTIEHLALRRWRQLSHEEKLAGAEAEYRKHCLKNGVSPNQFNRVQATWMEIFKGRHAKTRANCPFKP